MKKNFKTVAPTMAIAMFSIILSNSCNQSQKDESGGYECLSKARKELSVNNYDKARTLIDTLRANFPLAFNAREEGILLLDSIEISNAQSDLEKATAALTLASISNSDSLRFSKEEAEQKIKFFTKKLKHDRANFKKH